MQSIQAHVACVVCRLLQGQVAATGGDDNVVNLWRMREKETKNIMVRAFARHTHELVRSCSHSDV